MHGYMTSNALLPPGHYPYSSSFPAMMQRLSPSYTVSTEPVFMDHLLMNLGKPIRIATVDEKLDGILSGVAVDHLQLTVGDTNYHIRFAHIIYFAERGR